MVPDEQLHQPGRDLPERIRSPHGASLRMSPRDGGTTLENGATSDGGADVPHLTNRLLGIIDRLEAERRPDGAAGADRRGAIVRWVTEAAAEFDAAPVQAFVPILIERAVRSRLAATRTRRERSEFFRSSAAPAARQVVACVFALVRDQHDRLLTVRRVDSGNWELPGGAVEPGETLGEALIREVTEETGLIVRPGLVAAATTDPAHVLAYPTGRVVQQVAILLHAQYLGGRPRPDHDEVDRAAFLSRVELADLPVHPVVRERLRQALDRPLVQPFGPH